jgi:hypothetical protein
MINDDENNLAAAHQRCYSELVVELAEIFQVDANLLKQSGHLMVNNVHVALVDHGNWDMGRITVAFDLGPIPKLRAGEVYRQLLEQNVRLPSSFGVFGVIPESGHGALLYHHDFSATLNGQVLARHINEVSAAYVSLESSFEQAERSRWADGQQNMVRHRLMKKTEKSL